MSKGTTMSHLAHSTKLALTRASTTPAALAAGLNQEFVDTRRRLDQISTALTDLHTHISHSRHVWAAVARSQRDFARRLAASFPQAGPVHAHAAEVDRVLRSVQRALIELDGDEEGGKPPHRRIADVLVRYVENVHSIREEYAALEKTYTEKARYERKVDKLERKAGSEPKDGGERLRRNMAKLDTVQTALDTKMDAVLARMRDAFQKHEAVLQCAHHAFWCANNVYLETVQSATHDVRAESHVVHGMLVGLQLQEGRKLLPIERRDTSESAMSALAPAELRKQLSLPGPPPGPTPPSPRPNETGHRLGDDLPQQDSNVLSVLSTEALDAPQSAEDSVLQIPDVPMEMPAESPKTHKLSPQVPFTTMISA